ncbi:YALIA101S01e04522g1_1 [Yarrowia lipolytica]|nr:Recyclin-1 [Yarrowia lipolytica]SEI30657.1 YALIA101S01e04522g1_1 [Yarrowia lipolytica]
MSTLMWSAEQSAAAAAGSHLQSAAEWPDRVLTNLIRYMSPRDVVTFGSTCKRIRQVSLRDDLWQSRLEAMDLWDDAEAKRKKNDEFHQHEEQELDKEEEEDMTGAGQKKEEDTLVDLLDLSPTKPVTATSTPYMPPADLSNQPNPLTPFDGLESTYGKALETYSSVYRNLAPFYYDMVQSGAFQEPLLFKLYDQPEHQARALVNLKRLSYSLGDNEFEDENRDQLASIAETFENAALREFELGIDEGDFTPDSRVKRYAQVLKQLGATESCVELFVHKRAIDVPHSPAILGDKGINMTALQNHLDLVSKTIAQQMEAIDTVFGLEIDNVSYLFAKIVLEDAVIDTINHVLEAAREQETVYYLDAVPDIYAKLLTITDTLPSSINGHQDKYKGALKRLLISQYEFHVDQFMQLELDSFETYANDLVDSWDKETHDKEIATEHYYLSNVTKEKDKRDFLSSFKDVLMMPINVIGVGSSKDASRSGTPNPNANGSSSKSGTPNPGASRSGTPNHDQSSADGHHVSSPPPELETNLPTTELDAKAAIMNDRLQGINSLFNLELALNITKAGKASLERIKRFHAAGGQLAKDSKEQCERVFVSLIDILGKRHIGGGFDKALGRLDSYKPHNLGFLDEKKSKKGKKEEVKEESLEEKKKKEMEKKGGLEPLVVFAELVNIGDLIQQMIHVFFEEELAQKKFIDRNDFVSPSVQAKKKFEKQLDEYVARGLNQGIDVLSDQMDFLFVTTQLGSDFNPLPNMEPNMGPTECAKGLVDLLSVHMKILSGSTEKTVLDVFQQELGMRFFASICKHLKRKTISVDGAITVISDLNYYYSFVLGLKQRPLNQPFAALKEVGQMYLIDTKDAKALGKLLSDMNRFKGVFQPEEIYEFAHSRADWVLVKREVEKAMYGLGVDCVIS